MGRLFYRSMSWLEKLLASLENSPGGWSARKLTAFALTITAIALQWRNATPENTPTLVLIDTATALLCLGIITAAELVKLRSGKN